MKIGAFIITRKKKKSETRWINYLIKKEKKYIATQKIKKSDGAFIFVPASRNNYHISFNGIRFANSTELKSLEKNLPVISEKIKEAIRGGKI